MDNSKPTIQTKKRIWTEKEKDAELKRQLQIIPDFLASPEGQKVLHDYAKDVGWE